jgi:HSP20 family molecular chaperone IbpA
MFGKKRCRNCGREIKKEWEFCPYCGAETRERRISPFGDVEDIFGDIEKEFERADKMIGSEFFKFPRFKVKPEIRGGGISITIHSVTGKEPKIRVRTSGEYKKLEPEIKRKLGVAPAIEEVEEARPSEAIKPVKTPKVTEEAETEVKTIGNKQIVTVKLPGVKKEEDVEVKRLEQSIEVKAFAGDKAYFTLIPVPPAASVNKKFKAGILEVEIER